MLDGQECPSSFHGERADVRKGPLTWAWLGRVGYRDAIFRMDQVAKEVLDRSEAGRILFLEHPPTVTLGRRATIRSLKVSPEELRYKGIELERSDRGGEATYHGPGQLIVYPVLNLKALWMGVKAYVAALEEAMCVALAQWGISEARLDAERPGVWTRRGKIASIGLRVRGEIVSHGFAMNLKMDVSPFNMIVSCGLPDAPVACVSDFIVRPAMADASSVLARCLGEALGRPVSECEPAKLIGTHSMIQKDGEVTKLTVQAV